MRFLFGGQPKTQAFTDPGVQQSNQFFQQMAQQPMFLSPEQKSYYDNLFGTGKERAAEGAVGARTDLGIAPGKSGVLAYDLSDIENKYALGQATSEMENLERRRGQVYQKMGQPQQQVATTPGGGGLVQGLIGPIARIARG